MKVTIIEDKKDKLIFDIEGETNTLTGALKKELWNDNHVKVSGYYIEHPLINIPRFIVQTQGKDAKKAVKDAIKRLEKQADKLISEAKNIK